MSVSWVGDLRSALRRVRRQPRTSTVAIATAACGLAGFTLLYSIVAGVLLRPLPFPRSDDLHAVYQALPALREQRGMERFWNSFGFSHHAFREIQEAATEFDAVAALSSAQKVLRGSGPPEPVDLLRVSSSAFGVLGIAPAMGRVFVAGEDAPGGAAVAMISYGLWRSRFGGTPDIVGRTLDLDGTLHEIVGVLPSNAQLPRSATPDIWVPIGDEPDDIQPRKSPLALIGRLRPGGDSTRAREQVAGVLRAADLGYPTDARIVRWQEQLTQSSRAPLRLLLAGAVVLLLLTCVSMAGISAIELQRRLPELATRGALGASRGQIARLLLIEANFAALVAATLGCVIASATLPVVAALSAGSIALIQYARIDASVVAVAVVVALCVSSAVVLAVLARVGPGRVVQSGTTNATASRPRQLLVRTILGAQFGLATLLLVGGGYLTLNLLRLRATDPGFEARSLTAVTIDPGQISDAPSATALTLEAIAERVRALPTVRAASVGSAIPFSGNSSGAIEVHGPGRIDTVTARLSSVLPGFIETLGLRIVSGRAIDVSDRQGAPPSAVVNEQLARQFWPGVSALGQRVSVGRSQFTVVGVASDVRHGSLIATPLPTLYLAESQRPSRFAQLLVHSECPTDACIEALAPAIRRIVHEVAPTAVVRRFDPLSDLVARTFRADNFRASLTTAFAVVAALLALAGILGTVAHAARQSWRELAIRLALGGNVRQTTMTFVRPFAIALLAGTVGGALAAAACARLLREQLPLVSANEPGLLLGIASLMVGVGLGAAWVVTARGLSRDDLTPLLRPQ